MRYRVFDCSVDFGDYRLDIAADSMGDAEDIVEENIERKLEKAADRGTARFEREQALEDIQPMVECEVSEFDDDPAGSANVKGGFVFGEVTY